MPRLQPAFPRVPASAGILEMLHCEQNNGRASVDRLVRQSAANLDGRISTM